MTGIIPPVTIIKQGLDDPKEDKTGGTKFLLTAAPKDSELEVYAKVLRRHGCTNLVRTYVPVYPSYPGYELHAFFLRQGITVHDLEFEDGSVPSPPIIEQWLKLLQVLELFQHSEKPVVIALHCVSGLSCAPVLIGLALIGTTTTTVADNLEIITLLRRCRRGCLNHKQTNFLANYHSQNVKEFNKSRCVIL